MENMKKNVQKYFILWPLAGKGKHYPIKPVGNGQNSHPEAEFVW